MSQGIKRAIKNWIKRLMRICFEMGQRFHVDILPRHFYSEIPDIRTLRNNKAWRVPRSMKDISGPIEAQLAWVDECTRPYRANLTHFKIHEMAVRMNGSDQGYGEVEADFLYCFVRSQRPRQIVQIGCGVSTAICLLAAADEGYVPRITCIEPYPTAFLQLESERERITLITQKIEDVSIDFISRLQDGDLFFVDSSHTLGPAGEANLIILEILPRLATGVYAHFHDIYFPYDYGTDTLSSALFFPHETALLYAFLLMNRRFEIAASLSMLHHYRLNELVQYFPDMNPREFDEGLTKKVGHFPSSIFLRRRSELAG
ncbi:class I SAM-dependent methyltransferase [Telmatobacter sp. DSM 110680]|uniref:Class I SAM-dependent methyltransferase n=1 Tax=Telmatobacter sp. DSM 110680 TaxID=3036704 RepID=A0AAU7DEH2_9BACT